MKKNKFTPPDIYSPTEELKNKEIKDCSNKFKEIRDKQLKEALERARLKNERRQMA